MLKSQLFLSLRNCEPETFFFNYSYFPLIFSYCQRNIPWRANCLAQAFLSAYTLNVVFVYYLPYSLQFYFFNALDPQTYRCILPPYLDYNIYKYRTTTFKVIGKGWEVRFAKLAEKGPGLIMLCIPQDV